MHEWFRCLLTVQFVGHSPTICPGGAMEVAFVNHKKETTMYIRKRLGLVKIALANGVPIIPTVAYNQRHAFGFYVPKWRILHKIGKVLLLNRLQYSVFVMLGRKMGFIPAMITGIFNIPFAQPKSEALQVIVGKPIPIPKAEGGKPTDADVVKYHAIWVDATIKLYNDHKEQFGMGDVALKVL